VSPPSFPLYAIRLSLNFLVLLKCQTIFVWNCSQELELSVLNKQAVKVNLKICVTCAIHIVYRGGNLICTKQQQSALV